MIVELPKESLSEVSPLLHEFSHYIALAALFEGRIPGRVWVDRLEEPTTTLLG